MIRGDDNNGDVGTDIEMIGSDDNNDIWLVVIIVLIALIVFGKEAARTRSASNLQYIARTGEEAKNI